MQRSTIPQYYTIDDEPIVLSKALFDKLLSKPNSSDLIALYCFYYYTAKWQHTNRPKATDNYCMRGLNWGWARFNRTKKTLIRLGMIKIVQSRIAGRIDGWYIRINFIWAKEKILEPLKTSSSKRKSNALSSNNQREALTIKKRNEKYMPLAIKLSNIIKQTLNIKHPIQQKKNWCSDLRQLEEANGVTYARIKRALEWYEDHIGEQYVPVIQSAASLRSKFAQLESAMGRDGVKLEVVKKQNDDDYELTNTASKFRYG